MSRRRVSPSDPTTGSRRARHSSFVLLYLFEPPVYIRGEPYPPQFRLRTPVLHPHPRAIKPDDEPDQGAEFAEGAEGLEMDDNVPAVPVDDFQYDVPLSSPSDHAVPVVQAQAPIQGQAPLLQTQQQQAPHKSHWSIFWGICGVIGVAAISVAAAGAATFFLAVPIAVSVVVGGAVLAVAGGIGYYNTA